MVDVQDYLKYFVEYGIYLYGETFPSINVHSLLHLKDDYEVRSNSFSRIRQIRMKNQLILNLYINKISFSFKYTSVFSLKYDYKEYINVYKYLIRQGSVSLIVLSPVIIVLSFTMGEYFLAGKLLPTSCICYKITFFTIF